MTINPHLISLYHMKLGKSFQISGFTIIILLPWLLAAAGVLFGAVAWRRPARLASESDRSSPEESQAMKTLELALSTAKAENQALRQELDRLLSPEGKGSVGHTASAVEGAVESSITDADRQDLVKHLQESLALAGAGDETAKKEASKQIWDLLRSGPESFSTLRDAYLGTADPQGRRLLLGAMAFSQAPQVKDFLVDQVQVEKDPDLRRMLIKQAARFATPDVAENLQTTFLQTLESSDDSQLRSAAVRGLRYARGEAVPEALLQAASDPSEDVRLAAIDVLASNRKVQQQLRDLIANDPSPRIRQLGECRLMVAEAFR